jgi:subtilase family serine protease
VVPDVAYDSDPSTGFPIYDSNNGGWLEVGGTSDAAPQWAALVAIADEGRHLHGLGTLSSSQTLTAIYQLLPHSDFHLIKNQFNTQTGWGTPIANKLIPDLASGKFV